MQPARRLALDEDIGVCDEIQECRAAGFSIEVERDAALAAVPVEVEAAGLGVWHVVAERAARAGGITFGRLGFGDVGSEICQELAAIWPGNALRQLQNSHTDKRSFDHAYPPHRARTVRDHSCQHGDPLYGIVLSVACSRRHATLRTAQHATTGRVMRARAREIGA